MRLVLELRGSGKVMPFGEPRATPATAQPACTLSLERWRMDPNSRPRMEVRHRSRASAPCLEEGRKKQAAGPLVQGNNAVWLCMATACWRRAGSPRGT